jgi:hypothetical protein
MTPKEYVRKSFAVVAEEVNFENVHEVAAWCKGKVEMKTTKLMGTETKLPVIVLKGQGDSKHKEFLATLGCFIVELKGSFRVYKAGQFWSAFDEKEEKTVEVGLPVEGDGHISMPYRFDDVVRENGLFAGEGTN